MENIELFLLPRQYGTPTTMLCPQPFQTLPLLILIILSLNNLSKVVIGGPLSQNVGVGLAKRLVEK
jgi:hypothetical protein